MTFQLTKLGNISKSLMLSAWTGFIIGGFTGSFLIWLWVNKRFKAAIQPNELFRSIDQPTCRADWLRSPSGNRPRIILIATGSVASVKVPQLALALSDFADVAVILTSCGKVMASKCIAGRYSPKNFEQWVKLIESNAIKVLHDSDEWDLYEDVSEDAVVHIELRKWGDLALVAPCSANTLAKVAIGLCDNLASCILRAWDPTKPLLIAPAMNTVMWEHPSTSVHLNALEKRNCMIIPPASKRLACGDTGRGALAQISDILLATRTSLEGFQLRRSGDACGSWKSLGFQEWEPSLNELGGK